MSNDWYTASGAPAFRARLDSSDIRDLAAALESIGDRLPDPAGEGAQGFSGGLFSSAQLFSPTIEGGTVGSITSPVTAFAEATHLANSGATDPADEVFPNTASLIYTEALTQARLYIAFAAAKFILDENGNLVIGGGDAAIATTATDGFLHIPKLSGPPTGTPTAYTGTIPICYDASTDKIYAYNGGWLATGALT